MLVWVFLLGLSLGSFINVLIDRLPKGESVLTGRSRCDWCKKSLRWFELIPVVSFISQSGRCRRCRHPLSLQYPLIELLTGLSLAVIYLLSSYSLILLFSYSLIFVSLLVIFMADLKYQIIPDSMILLGLVGALPQLFRSAYPGSFILSALGTCAFFFLLNRATGGRGMGLGDVKLAFLLGLLAGFPRIVVGLYLAFLTGAMAGVILILTGKKSLKSRLAFGPFLIVGFGIGAIWGDKVIAWFLKLI